MLRTVGDSGSVAALPALGTLRAGIETMNEPATIAMAPQGRPRAALSPYRKAACKKLAIGVGLVIFALVWIFVCASFIVYGNRVAMMLVGAPSVGFFAYALRPFFEGFLGLMFGMPVKDFTDRMDTKPLWQRFIIAVVLLVFLVAFVFGVFLLGLGEALIWISNRF